jgi:hypothetical protein
VLVGHCSAQVQDAGDFRRGGLHTATDLLSAVSDRNQFPSELSATELAVLRPHLVDFDITAGDCLHRIGDPIERVVFPHSGVICITVSLRDTAGPVVALVGREGVVGGLWRLHLYHQAATPRCELVGGHHSFQRPLSVTLWITPTTTLR